jgi:hypothetical protein
MIRRLALRWLFVVAFGAASASCLSPTLPLPPPEEPDTITQGECDGATCDWTIAGDCDPGARVTVVNDKLGIGLVMEDRGRTGRYQVTLPGVKCDRAYLLQEVDNETSATRNFVLEPVVGGVPTSGTACK